MVLFVLVLGKLVLLDQRVKYSAKKGYQPGSARNLCTYINRYLDFCLEHSLPPIPADGTQLRRFIQYLADSPTISAIDTINNYIWGVRTFHKMVGVSPPDTGEFITQLVIKGIKLQLARPISRLSQLPPN